MKFADRLSRFGDEIFGALNVKKSLLSKNREKDL